MRYSSCIVSVHFLTRLVLVTIQDSESSSTLFQFHLVIRSQLLGRLSAMNALYRSTQVPAMTWESGETPTILPGNSQLFLGRELARLVGLSFPLFNVRPLTHITASIAISSSVLASSSCGLDQTS